MSADFAERTRNKRGEFATVRNPLDYYEIVRDVALAAAKRDDDPLKDPAMVTQRLWDAARHLLTSKWHVIPCAREICRQLADREGVSYAWPQLLADVFDPDCNFVQTHAQRLSAPDRTISDDHVYWALNSVARAVGTRTLRPNEYESGRKQLLEQAGSKTRRLRELQMVLPTGNQITTHCRESWDRALEIAMLASRSTTPPSHVEALRVASAIGLFYLEHGYLPTSAQLQVFARRNRFGCQSFGGKHWEAWCAEAVAMIKAQGLPEPSPYPSKAIPAEWQRVALDATVLPSRHIGGYSRLQVLEAVREFKLALGAGEAPSDRRYRAFSRRRAGVPSLQVIKTHGGIAVLLFDLADPDWRAGALASSENGDRVIAATNGRTTIRKPVRRNPEQRIKFVRLLSDHGPMGNLALAKKLGVTRPRVSQLFMELERRGLAETTKQNRRSPDQRYQLTATGVESLGDEPALRELLQTALVPSRPHDRQSG